MSGEMIVMAGDREESNICKRSPALSGDLAALVKEEFPVSAESRSDVLVRIFQQKKAITAQKLNFQHSAPLVCI